jgi:hypothetical protein
MRYFLPITAILLVGCGHSQSAQKPAPVVAPAFSDVAGTYLATVTATSGSYNTLLHVGDSQTATVTAQGQVTAGSAGYTLGRHPDGSFQLVRTINATTAEIGFASNTLTSLTIEYHVYMSITGTVSYVLVRTGAG